MIPTFDKNGYLPPGIHAATMDEIEATFGSGSEIRRVQMNSLRWLMELVGEASVLRVVLNGSWVTSEPEPADIDCVLLAGPDWGKSPEVEQQLQDGLPFISPQIGNEAVFDSFVTRIFSSDRAYQQRGMIEVIR